MPTYSTAQYGDFVQKMFGKETWDKVLQLAAVQEPLPPVSYPYHEDVVHSLLECTAQAISASVPDVARAFGRFCFKASQGTEFCKLIHSIAHSLLEFLTSLNNLHVILSGGVGEDTMPTLCITEVTSTSLQLHYRSSYSGLSYVLVGICEAVAREVFGTWVNFKSLPLTPTADNLDHHESWLVTYESQADQLSFWEQAKERRSKACFSPEPALFHQLFPNHILIDKHMNIAQLGSALDAGGGSGLISTAPGSAPQVGAPIRLHFELIHPPTSSNELLAHMLPAGEGAGATEADVADQGCWNFERLSGMPGERVVLRIKPHFSEAPTRRNSFVQPLTSSSDLGAASTTSGHMRGGERLHGSFYPTRTPDGARALLFVGSEVTAAKCLDDFVSSGLRISDVPAYDLTPCLMVSGSGCSTPDMLVQLQNEKQELLAAKQTLEQDVEKSNKVIKRLRKTSADMLSMSTVRKDSKRFDAGSPSEMAINILECLIQEKEVDMMQVYEVYDALVSSGTNIFRPVNVMKKMRSFDNNDEVNRNLMQLLLQNKDYEDEDDEDWKDWDLGKVAEEVMQDSRNANAAAAAGAVTKGMSLGLGAVAKQLSKSSNPSTNSGTRQLTSIASMWKKVRSRASVLIDDNSLFATMQLVRSPDEPLHKLLATVTDWGFDVFELDRLTHGRPLSTMAFVLLKRLHLVPGRLDLNETRLARFLCRIEEGYPDNPYHCRIHAADVVRSLFMIMTQGGVVKTCFQHDADMALLTAIVAAVMHDYEHKGVNNDFLVKTSDQLALLYNDRSPLENHHLASGFMLLKEEQYDFMRAVPAKSRERFRKQVIEMVLATDMKQHFTQLSLFNTKFSTPMNAGRTTSGRTVSGNPSGGVGGATMKGSASGRSSTKMKLASTMSLARVASRMNGPPMDDDTRSLVLQMSLKMADLGHLASPMEVHIKWVQRLEEEFFRQGDQEVGAALPISPLMDRLKDGVTLSQKGFFTIVVMPQFQTFCGSFPGCQPLLEAVKRNETLWKS